jgi:C4-dicarboxylate-specific signal transduction histidine kinase
MIAEGHLAQLLALVQVSQQLSPDTDEAELVAALVRGAISIAAAYRVRLVGHESETFLVKCEARRSRNDEIVVSHRRTLVESEELFKGAFYTASQTGMRVFFGPISFDLPEVWASPQAYAHESLMLFVPLPTGDQPKEMLCLERHRDAPPFEASLIPYLQILSAQAAVILENARFHARVAVEDRKKEELEISLRANEKEFAHTQRMSQTGSWRWHAITDMMEASPECFRIYEIPHERRVPSARFTDLTHPDDFASVRIALGRAVAARRVFKLEFRIMVGFGEIKYVQIEGHPQVDDIEALQYVGVVVDVTERRNAENALQAARAELARAHRLSTMGEMAASIVHEIYQPLTGIITNAEVCLRWLSKSPAETARASDSARRVVRDARRAAEVFRGLRAVASNSGIVKVPVDLDDAIREVAFLLQGELDRANIRLRLQTAAPNPVLGDRTQIQQVLENLIRNAMDALLPVIGTQRFLIVSSAPHNAGFAIVTVQDNGCGFDEHSPEELFDALFTTKPNGMGMGLKVCRSIVEAHGGVLQAERSEQHTVFRFTLPYMDGTSGE